MSEIKSPPFVVLDRAPAGAREWKRVFALFLLVLALSVTQPLVLVSIPLLALVLASPTRRLPGLIAGALAGFIAFGAAPRDALGYLERGWAILLGGWFAALTLRSPGLSFFARALGAVAGAMVVSLGLLVAIGFSAGPAQSEGAGPFATVDLLVEDRMRAGAGPALEAVRALADPVGAGDPVEGDGPEPGAPASDDGPLLGPALEDALQRGLAFHATVYPALLGLASLAALGVAWWIYLRFARGAGGGLGPMREFRFNDHLVWLFIIGLVLLLVGQGEVWRGEPLARTGSNALVFMGALYALRGAAVVAFMSGGLSLLGAALLLMTLVFVAPVILITALLIGLGDTWLDVRAKRGVD